MTKLFGYSYVVSLMFFLTTGGCSRPPASTANSSRNRTADAGNDSVPTETTGGASTNVREAIRLYEQGDFANAKKIARSIVLASPNDLQASAILVSILAERGEYSSAISMLDGMAAVHLNQQDEIGAQAADLAYQSGEVNDAISRFEHLIRRSPLHHAARRRLAQMLNEQGYRFDANEHLRVLAGQVPLSIDELRGLSYPLLPFVNVTVKPNIHDASEIRKLRLLTAARALQSQGDVAEYLELLSQETYNALDRSESQNAAIDAFRLWVLASSQQYDALVEAIGSSPKACQIYREFWIAAGTLAAGSRPIA